MDGLEWNKIAAAGLIGLLTLKGGQELSKFLIHPHELGPEQHAYVVLPTGGAATTGAAAAPVSIMGLLGSTDITRGEKLARQCAQCHTLSKGGANGIGPNLFGVVGGARAHATTYTYSKGLSAMKGERWSFENLSDFLKRPRDFIVGTKMSFAGMKADQDRADLIAYLNTLSDQPLPLPAPVTASVDAPLQELEPVPVEASVQALPAAPAPVTSSPPATQPAQGAA